MWDPSPGLLPLIKPPLRHISAKTTVFHDLILLGKAMAVADEQDWWGIGQFSVALRQAHLEQASSLAQASGTGTDLSARRSLFICGNGFRCCLLLLLYRLHSGQMTSAAESTLGGVPSCCSQQVLPEPKRQNLFNHKGGFLKKNASWHFHSQTVTAAFSEAKLSCVPLPPPDIGNKILRRNKTFC